MAAKRNLREFAFKGLFPVLILGALLLLSATPFGRQLENLTLDWRFKARGGSDPPSDSRLLLVGIGEEGLQQWGRWPWPRKVHGELSTLLLERPPKVLGETKRMAEAHKSDMTFRLLDRVVLWGRMQAVDVHEVVGITSELTPETLLCLQHYQKGIETYFLQQWKSAKNSFAAASTLEPRQPEAMPGTNRRRLRSMG